MSPRASLIIIVFFATATLVCLRLGFWQVDRLHQRRAANAIALQARTQPVVPLDEETTGDSGLIERQVSAVGRYDHAHDIVLRGRAYQGTPGVEIVTPLVFEGGRTAILVHRGFVPAPDAMSVETDSLREPGMVRVEGLALTVPTEGGAPLKRGGRVTWGRLDLEALGAEVPYSLAPVYIRQLPDAALPRFPRRLEAPPIDDGPHLSYAIQWFAFAIMAVGFGVVVWRQSGKKKG